VLTRILSIKVYSPSTRERQVNPFPLSMRFEMKINRAGGTHLNLQIPLCINKTNKVIQPKFRLVSQDPGDVMLMPISPDQLIEISTIWWWIHSHWTSRPQRIETVEKGWCITPCQVCKETRRRCHTVSNGCQTEDQGFTFRFRWGTAGVDSGWSPRPLWWSHLHTKTERCNHRNHDHCRSVEWENESSVKECPFRSLV